jgi:hypothetical protein
MLRDARPGRARSFEGHCGPGTTRGQDPGVIPAFHELSDRSPMDLPGRQLRLGVVVGVLAGAVVTLLLQTLNGLPKPF